MKVKDVKRHKPFSNHGKVFFYAGKHRGAGGAPGNSRLYPNPGPIALAVAIIRGRKRYGF
jgi:hypothetical protein